MKARKFTFPTYRGEQSPSAKLTAAQVTELRRLAREEGKLHTELATLFSISATRAGQIVRGEAWTHLLPPCVPAAGTHGTAAGKAATA